MLNRACKRIPLSLEGELISYGERYCAFTNNISENGICARIPLVEREMNSELDPNIYLKLRLPSGESVNLECTKKWSYKKSPGSLIENIGIEVNDPPQEYRSFCRHMMILINSL